MIPIYVSNRNRLTALIPLIEFLLELPDAAPTILDCASDYPPLLRYYDDCPVPVVRLKKNWGPRVAWNSEQPVQFPGVGGYYVCTDGDLLLDEVPTDVLTVLKDGLDRYPDYCKVGLNEDYSRMAASHPLRPEVENRIGPYWRERVGEFWRGDIDMTFAMYRGGGAPCVYGPALRTDRPYVCSQLSWEYLPEDLPEDELYYLRTAGANHLPGCVWSTILKERIERR